MSTRKSLHVDLIGFAPQEPVQLLRPLFATDIPAGYPSPADDYVEQMLDLNEYCVRNAPATYFVRVREDGYSMTDAGIYPGDLLCVDRSQHPQDGDFVIAVVDGEFTLKELVLSPIPTLKAHNPDYADIVCTNELEVFGVVTAVIRKFRRGRHVRPY